MKAQTSGAIYVGTSGWSYDHWKGCFYPKGVSGQAMLPWYAGHFQTVEINNSFYRLPLHETLKRWRDAVPVDFVFSVKASRYITHMKKLLDPAATTRKFFSHAEILGDRLGPILFQLPPHWSFNEQRLANFLDILPVQFRYVFEFRDRSWFDDRAYTLLARHHAAFCIYDLAGLRSPNEITADFVYVRLHGPSDTCLDSYDTAALSAWAETLSRWSARGHTVYCYFNNDVAGYAVENASRLRSLLENGEGQSAT